MGEKHFCMKHNKVVNKIHIDECDLLTGKYHPNEFYKDLQETSINLIPKERYEELEIHLGAL